jgi:hypothetical protein
LSARRLNDYWLGIPARHHPFLGMDPVGAKALEERLRQKKTAITDAV